MPGLGERVARVLLEHWPLGPLVRRVARIRASVHGKLLAAFLLIAVLLIAMGGMSLQTIASVSNHSRLLDQARERVDASRQIEQALGLQMSVTRTALLLGDNATIQAVFRENNRFAQTFDRLDAGAPPAQRETIKQPRSTQDKVMVTVARIADFMRDGKTDDALALHLSEGYPLYRDMARLVTRAVQAEEAEMGRLREGVAAASRRGYLIMGGFAGASIFLLPRAHPGLRHLVVVHPARSPGRGLPRPGRHGRLRRDHRRAQPRRVRRPRRADERDEPGAGPPVRRAAARVPAPRRAQRRAGAGEQGQIRLPGEHEPRAAHAAERDPRLHRDDPRRGLRRGADADPGAHRRHSHVRPPAPRAHQQRARPRQDRGRAHGARAGRVLGRGRAGHGAIRAALARRGEGADADRHRAGRRPAVPGRRQADHPVRHEPRRQRAEVHPPGARRDPRRASGRDRAVLRRRHRDRHPRRAARSHLRGVPAGGPDRHAGVRWDRARPVDHQEVRELHGGRIFALAGDDDKAREAGAAAYLAKPYSPRELLEVIRRLAPES